MLCMKCGTRFKLEADHTEDECELAQEEEAARELEDNGPPDLETRLEMALAAADREERR